MDFSRPFIVAPAVAKDGEEKIEAWDKFQRFCFVIGTEAFLREALPAAAAGAHHAASRTDAVAQATRRIIRVV